MDDDEEEMARLRKSKKHQAFEKKFDRHSARMLKEIQRKQMDKARSPSPISEQKIDSNSNQMNDLNLPMAFGKQSINENNSKKSATNNQTKVNFSEDFVKAESESVNDTNPKNKKFEKNTKKYLDHILSAYEIPMRYVAKLKGHSKLISTMCIDRSGTRLITGSYDNTVKLWDFGGMNEKLESFREIVPCDGYPIKTVAYNYSGSMFLCCTQSHKPLIYDRDGRQLMEFKQGDMYIRDMNHTFGHTMPLMGGKWFGYNANKANVDEIATWSQDSTFRIWSMSQSDGKCKQIIKARNKTGKRTSICCADFGNVNNLSFLIVIGCNDGSIQLFDHKSHCKRPTKTLTNAHVHGTDISDIMIDSQRILSRGGMNDNTLKIWDIRKLSQPIKIFENMWNITSLSNICKSPSFAKSKLYITSCSNEKDQKMGKSTLCCIDSKNLMEMIRIPISDRAINSVIWNNKINQLFVAGNDSNVRVFYEDSPKSKNGVLLCAKRRFKKKHIDEQMKYFKIINPNALRVYKKQSQILAEKKKKDLLMHKPEMPHYGIGALGRQNTESFSHHVYKSQEKNIMSQVDPRDRLLLFNEKAVQNQQFTAIYNINQPKPIFMQKNEEEIEANSIVSKLYKEKEGARQYNVSITDEPPHKKQKIN